jgi:hypothetical protein
VFTSAQNLCVERWCEHRFVLLFRMNVFGGGDAQVNCRLLFFIKLARFLGDCVESRWIDVNSCETTQYKRKQFVSKIGNKCHSFGPISIS